MIDLFLRDASWHPRSKQRWKMPRYHLPSKEEECLARCSRRIMLITESPVDGENLRDNEVCARCLPEVKRLRASLRSKT